MGRLKIYDLSTPANEIVREREERYLSRTPYERFTDLLALISLSVQMNGGAPLKTPQRKGLVISKPQ